MLGVPCHDPIGRVRQRRRKLLDTWSSLCHRAEERCCAVDLDIQASDVARVMGRAALPLSHSFVRELEAADLLRLEVEKGSKPPSISRISDRHHALARALANGDAPGEAAIKTGYSASRISILQNDPAFQELLAFYRESKNLAEAQVMDRVGTMTLTALAMLEDRMENSPDDMKTRELLDIATSGLDRSGHGPSAKLQVTSLTLSSEDMAKLAAAAKDPHVTVIEARAQSTGTSASPATSTESMANTETSRLPGQGDGIRASSGEGTPQTTCFQRPALVYHQERAVAPVHGPAGDQSRAAGSLPNPAIPDPPD